MTEAVRVIVVDDAPDMLRALREVIDSAPDLVCVGEAASGEDALDLVSALPADVLVLDVKMEGIDGIETLRRLRAFSEIAVVMHSVYDEKAFFERSRELGACAYVVKGDGPRVLLETIRGAALSRAAS